MVRTRSIPILLSGIALIGAMIFSYGLAVAQPDSNSATYVMPACRDVAALIKFSNEEESKADVYNMGFCAGIITGLSYIGQSHGICLPDGVASQRVAGVIVQYIDGRPERMNENFMLLAVEALRAAWPCKN